MIPFACAKCGTRFRVKEEFAGRSTRCPTCKHPLTVPRPALSVATLLSTGSISGAPSSLHQAGLDPGVTLGASRPAAGGKSLAERLDRAGKGSGRYIVEGEIARGGMGAVLRALDRDLRREVAVKFMLDDAEQSLKARFVEEAQIHGQLEHPNIVPIHELGLDAQQRLFFSMKLVQGRSLAQVLQALRDRPQAAKEWPLGRLLTVLVNVCNALAYAHSRGVVHRDLKPANIMLGDYGEVYLMDWGLAKVLRAEGNGQANEADPAEVDPAAAFFAAMSGPASAGGPTRVETSREEGTDLTQEGSIMGTPLYMPPEQARGRVQAVDQRSDVYSLGAILYEVLCLQPPVDRAGGARKILERVIAGDIEPPERREPERTRLRHVPAELSAVAMKALAKDPRERYQAVEDLREDIERYQEGRSVSAKDDTAREVLVKFVKRNKAVSSASAVSLVLLAMVLAVAFRVNSAARVHAEQQQSKAEEAYGSYLREQQEKEAAIRRSVPAFLRSSRQLANDGAVAEAQHQVDLCLSYEAGNAQARLLRAQLLLAQERWEEGRAELNQYLKMQPDDTNVRLLESVVANGDAKDPGFWLAVARTLQGDRLYGVATPLLRKVEQVVKSRTPLAAMYRKQVEGLRPGQGVGLIVRPDGRLSFQGRADNPAGRLVTDLQFLHGIPLEDCVLHGWKKIQDLGPLRGMPLRGLHLPKCEQIQNLGPLRGMPLEELNVSGCVRIDDLVPLRGMPLKDLNLGMCAQVHDLEPLAGLPLGKLDLTGCIRVRDLAPLRGVPLRWLNLNGCNAVEDLAPLEGMHLTKLFVAELPRIQDLSPLQGMSLEELDCRDCILVESIAPLKGMPLTHLNLTSCRLVDDLEPLRGMPLVSLSLFGTTVSDLTPLEGMPLEWVSLNPALIRKGIDVLRRTSSLKTVSLVRRGGISLAADEFWRRYDAGEFRK